MHSRRTALKTAAFATLGLTARAQNTSQLEKDKNLVAPVSAATGLYRIKNGRIKQSVVPWCFKPMPPDELVHHSSDLGLASVELIDPKYWPLIKELGMTMAIASSHPFAKGFAHREEWAECHALLRERIEQCAAAGYERVITFSGFRRGLSDEEGTANMIAGLKEILPFAEEKKVTLCIEMLNSRVNITMKGHPDYFCDSMERTIDICRQIGSPRCRVLFDIYHVQIMHGDVISRLHKDKDYIAHVHTAGVPGRNEIDDTQELNYPAIMHALLDIGYTGFVGQEFIPAHEDKVASLADGVRICDVA
ncbi:MAG TPA: TIM barrel protein [Chthoniobacter sp.]|jgi:hydroxypyruvate isomerase